MIYAINMKGWEEYEPHWFICDCSKKEFKKVVLSSIEEALDNLMSDEMAKRTWIDGHALLSFLLPVMEKKGFKEVKIDYEISLYGGCLYTSRDKKQKYPEIFSKSIWDKILKHNKKVRDRREDRLNNQKDKSNEAY